MFSATVTVPNKTGLHARPASNLVGLCKQYESDILLFTDEDEINAKSIVSLLAGGIMQGDTVRIEITGPDEETAGPAIVDFINQLTD